MPRTTMTAKQKTMAKHLRAVRPATIPGTNVIPIEKERLAWYALVTYHVNILLKDTADCAPWLDLCGVPN